MTILTKLYMRAPTVHLLPIDMRDPSLVLYLPLWYPHGDMTGSTIYSYDKNRHSCTVTGATWGLQGRTFDGTDDKILVPDATILDCASAFTGEIWLRVATTQDNKGILAKDDGVTNTYKFRTGQIGNTTKVVFILAASGGQINLVSTSVYNDNVFHHIVGTYDGTNVRLFFDGNEEDSDTTSGNIVTTSADVLLAYYNVAGTFFNCVIGEVRIYNRALNLSELNQNRNATKWRYQ